MTNQLTRLTDHLIFVDADACPVKDEVKKVAERHNWQAVIVSNGGMRPSRDPMVVNIIVPHGADAADDWIVEEVKPGDVVITGDIPLAKRVLDKDARAIDHRGKTFTEQNIGMAVAMRDLKQELRETSDVPTFNKPFSKADRSSFLQALDRVLSERI